VEELPSFGARLVRLFECRKLDLGTVSREAGVTESQLAAVLDGTIAPDPSFLRRLAPSLRLHSADLFVIAGLAVPDDLAPLDPDAWGLSKLIWTAGWLPGQVPRLLTLARSLPQQPRTKPVPPPPAHHRYPQGPGALLLKLLHNRNLTWTESVTVLYNLGGVGPWSAATVGAVGRGRKELSPELVAGFAAVVGIPARDLAVLVGADRADEVVTTLPVGTDTTDLIWEARRLTAAQLRQVTDEAHLIRHEAQYDLPAHARCRCDLVDGRP
jgi:transcriptional regulator with XRE-family HTH domain